jgi:hypothetical protein
LSYYSDIVFETKTGQELGELGKKYLLGFLNELKESYKTYGDYD